MAEQEKSNRGGVMPPPVADMNVGQSVKSEDAKPSVATPKKVEPMVPMQVVALRPGFYGNVRRKEGDKFAIADKKHLGKWMKPI
jgi:hypothetical protein